MLGDLRGLCPNAGLVLEAGCWGRRAWDSKAQRLPFRPALHWPASCPQVAYQGWLPSLENGIITALLAYSKGDSGYEKAFQHLKCFTSIFPVLLKKHGAISSPPIGTLLIQPICQDRAEWAEILNLGNRGGGGGSSLLIPVPAGPGFHACAWGSASPRKPMVIRVRPQKIGLYWGPLWGSLRPQCPDPNRMFS